MDFREFTFRDCPKRGMSNTASVSLAGIGSRKWTEKSPTLATRQAKLQASWRLFGRSQKGNSPKFVGSGCIRSGPFGVRKVTGLRFFCRAELMT